MNIYMKTDLVFRSPTTDLKKEDTVQANIVYVGETLNNFCQHTPHDIASKLGKPVLFWIIRMHEQKDKQDSSEEILKVLKKETIDFLRKAHPYYYDLKEPEDTDFILRFITGILALYKSRAGIPILQKDIITYLIGSQYGQIFEDYERVFSGSIDTSNKNSLDYELSRAFTDDCFLSFVNTHDLVYTVLRDTKFNVNGAAGKEIFLSHLMAWHVIYYIERKDIYPYQSWKNEAGYQKYSGFFRDFSDYYKRLRHGYFRPEMDGICYFNSIQTAVLTELEYIAAGSFKVAQCAGCYRYFVYSENKHDMFCSEPCRKTYTYWENQVKKARDTLRKKSESEKSYKKELWEFFTFNNILERISSICKRRKDYEIYFAIILGAFYARYDTAETIDKKVVTRQTTYTDRDSLVLFLTPPRLLPKNKEPLDDLFEKREDKEEFVKYIYEKSSKTDVPTMWKKAKEFLTSKEYKNYRRSSNMLIIPKTMRVKSPPKSRIRTLKEVTDNEHNP